MIDRTPLARARRMRGISHLGRSRSTILATTALSGIAAFVSVAPADAQTIPPECVVSPSPIAAGSEVTCVSPTPIGRIETAIPDLTVNIGDATTPTTVSGGADIGVDMRTATGSLTLNVSNADSLIQSNFTGVFLGITGGVDDVTIVSEGTITGGELGIAASNQTGSISITTADVTGTNRFGIDARSNGGAITVDSSAGTVRGAAYGTFARVYGSGAVSVTSADVVSGASGIGIDAQSLGGSVTVDSSGGDVSGGLYGIRVRGTGASAISITSGDVTGGTAGIRSRAADGPTTITVTSAATVTGTAGPGIYATSTGAAAAITVQGSSGDVIGATDGMTVATAGADIGVIDLTSVTGQAGDGLDLRSGGGAITVGNVDTILGTGGSGIFADSDGGAISIQGSGQVGGITGTAGAGILADATGGMGGAIDIGGTAPLGAVTGTTTGISATTDGAGSVTIDSSLGTVEGGTDGIRVRNLGTGAVTITTDDVSGTYGAGINAYSSAAGAGVTVDSSAGPVTGGVLGIIARNLGTGAVTVTTDDVSGGTGAGTTAYNGVLGTDLTVDSSTGSVDGGTLGVYAQSFGSGAVTVTTGDVNGASGRGIYAISSYGTDLTVDSSAGSVQGTSDGIRAKNFGTGAVSVTTAGVSGGGADGIYAYNSSSGTDVTVDSSLGSVDGGASGVRVRNQGNGAVTVTTDDVSGGVDGIVANNSGSGAMTVTTADVSGTTGSGIAAVNSAAGSDLVIDSTAGSVDGGTYGVRAFNYGSGTMTITTRDVSGANGDGMFVLSSGGGVTVDSSGGTVTGGRFGLVVQDLGAGAVSVTSGDVTATTRGGIFAQSFGGGVTVDSSAGTVAGGSSGIFAGDFGGAPVSVVAADVSGGSAYGILVLAGAGDANIVSTGLVSTPAGGAAGVYVEAGAGSATVSVNAVTTLADDAHGIFARSGGGDVSVSASGAVSTAGNAAAGIVAMSNSGDVRVSGAGTIMTAGADAAGIYVRSDAGDAYAGNGGSVTAPGTYSIGILALAPGGHATAVGNNVNVGGRNAIAAYGSLSASVTANGVVSSGADNAIFASSAGDVTFILGPAANVTGGPGFSALLGGSGGGTITVTNAGTLNTSPGGLAISTAGGATAISNSGTVNGRIQLTDLDDIFSNMAGGAFNAAGDSDFGTGTDTLVNRGTLSVDGTVSLLGLERLDNHNLVTMLDGAAGDGLTLPGNYIAHSTLAIDVSFDGTGSADMLVLGGSATGTTHVVFNDVSANPAFGTSVRFVDAGGGSDPGAFRLDPAAQSAGFLVYGLFHDAANDDFYLANAIGTPVFQTLKFAEGASSLWYRTADAWSAHMTGRRDGGTTANTPVWLEIYGTTTDHDESFAYTSNGFGQNIVLDYSQDYFGFQLGGEFGPGASRSGGWVFGVTGGYLSSNLGFEGTADNVEFDDFNIGVYAGYERGGLFVNALAKYDFVDADILNGTAHYAVSISGDTFGVRFEAGYRWSSGSFFAEPVASIEWQRSNLGDFSALGATVNFDDFDGLRGMAGLRLGGTGTVGSGNRLTVYGSGRVVHEFQGDDGMTFTSGVSSIAFVNDPIDTFGRFELGINIITSGGVSGFIEGNADVGDGYQGIGGRAGLRIAF